MKKIAIILCGSGFKDGSEIRESVGVLWAASQLKVQTQCFAPDAFQKDVVNCLQMKEDPSETRNMLVESARIARGQVKPISELKAQDFDALVIPGGFGVAKNLCDFAFKGSAGSVRSDVASVVESFHKSKKPIGAICIAPALLALTLKDAKLSLTLGAKSEASDEIEKLGHRHVEKKPDECHVDAQNKIVSTPAYMYDSAPLHEIFTGIQKCLGEVIKLI